MNKPRHRDRHLWRGVAVLAFGVAGTLFVTSGLNAQGLDLRASSVTDLDTVLRQQRDRTEALQRDVAALTAEIDELGRGVDDAQVRTLQEQIEQARGPAGFDVVRGPVLTVSLDDAPRSVRADAAESGVIQGNKLVVHQQDIQAVVNALWLGGAEAMTLQGQRIISTTGIKCIGNTVILHGVPYAPPYRIAAIGDVTALRAALDNDDYVDGYLDYVEAFDLGYEVSTLDEVEMPAYGGPADLRFARAAADPDDTQR